MPELRRGVKMKAELMKGNPIVDVCEELRKEQERCRKTVGEWLRLNQKERKRIDSERITEEKGYDE